MTDILTTYTPGPWTAATALALVDADCQPSINAGGKSIAMVRRKRGIALPEALANARLIAAAPELVEACRKLRNAQRAYMADRGNEALGRAVGEAAAEMDALLAKIDGEQP